jgi:phage shock protein C
MKRLYRSNDNKVFAGIFGGLGEYFDVDPVVLRLAFVFLVIVTAFIPGIIAYLAAIFIVPSKPGAGQE